MLNLCRLTRTINWKKGSQSYPNVNKYFINKLNIQAVIYCSSNNAEKENYMKEIIENFNSFSDNGNKKKNMKMQDFIIKTTQRKESLDSKGIKTKQKKISLNEKGVNIEDSIQEAINIMLNEGKYPEVKDIILKIIVNNNIPSYKSLHKVVGWLARHGDSTNIQVIQNVIKSNYPMLYEKENCFEHFLCEALFREGNHEKSFLLLTSLIDKSTKFKKVKETACFIMRLIVNASEECQYEAFQIARKFISQKNEYKPAIVLWQTCIKSNQYNLHCEAGKLWEEYSDLLEEEEAYISDIIELALTNKDEELLHRIMEIILKLKNADLLSKVLSSSLKFYCMAENLPKASEILTYAKEENVIIPASEVKPYLQLLNKIKLMSSKVAESHSGSKNQEEKELVKNPQEKCTEKTFEYKF